MNVLRMRMCETDRRQITINTGLTPIHFRLS